MPTIEFRCWLPLPKEPFPKASVSFCLDGSSIEIPRGKDGVFFVRAKTVVPGKHICSFIICGGYGWEWKVDINYGAPKPLKRRGILGLECVAQRWDIVVDVPSGDAP